MNINSISNQNFNGIEMGIRSRIKINRALDECIHDTSSRARLAEKIKACVDSKVAKIKIRDNGDTWVINNITNVPTKIKHPGNNLTKKFIKAVNLALAVKP